MKCHHAPGRILSTESLRHSAHLILSLMVLNPALVACIHAHVQVPGDFLTGKMALLWTGAAHVTYENTDVQRDYDLVEQAGRLARQAVLPGQESIQKLAEAVAVSYKMQLQEGMAELAAHGELAKKYCGGGWGGYALYLFETEQQRATFLQMEGSKAIEPFLHN